MKKKGVIELQFDWIFVIIAGAVILLFFGMLVNKQRDVSEVRSQITFQKNLQTILVGAEVDKYTVNVVKVPDREIDYSCEGFSVASLGAFKQRVTFAPDLIKSKTRKMITWSLDWRVPFRVTNFLYVTSPEVKYYIVDDDDVTNEDSIADQLFNLLPDKLDKELIVNVNSASGEGNYKVKFVFFTPLPRSLSSNFDDVNAIYVNGDLDGYGTIEFFEGNNLQSKGTSKYLKKEMLIGAVFAEDKEIYDCQVKKAKEILGRVAEVYAKRTEKIRSSTDDYCKTFYGGLVNKFRGLKNDDLGNVNSVSEGIENSNENIQINSCPLVY